MLIIDIMLSILVDMLFLIISIVIIGFFSDKTKKYRIITSIFVAVLLILEIFHYSNSEDTLLGIIFDPITHIFAGIVIFSLVNNLKFINKNRQLIGIISVALIIGLIELFLALLDIFTPFVNPNTIDIAYDITNTVIGGYIGHLISCQK